MDAQTSKMLLFALFTLMNLKGAVNQDLNPNIEIQPRNTAGELGSDVTLFCKWNNRNNGSVTWRYYDTGSASSGTQISVDTEIKEGQGIPPNKYGISGNHSDGEFDLKIKSLEDRDVRQYSCKTVHGAITYGLYVLQLGKPTFQATGKIEENEPFNLSCTVRFKSIPNWFPEVTISDGDRNLLGTQTIYEDRIVVVAEVSTPVDKQGYKCSASFASPPTFVIPDDSDTSFKHDKRAPLIIQEREIVPYTKSSAASIECSFQTTSFSLLLFMMFTGFGTFW